VEKTTRIPKNHEGKKGYGASRASPERRIMRIIAAIIWMLVTFWMPDEGLEEIEDEA